MPSKVELSAIAPVVQTRVGNANLTQPKADLKFTDCLCGHKEEDQFAGTKTRNALVDLLLTQRESSWKLKGSYSFMYNIVPPCLVCYIEITLQPQHNASSAIFYLPVSSSR